MSNEREVLFMDRQAIDSLVQRWTKEAIAQGRPDTFDELLAADVIDRSGDAPSRGVEPFKARAAAVRAAFADIDIRVDDLLVDGDAIAWRWTLTGTHVGSFAGLAPTGRCVTLRGVNFQLLKGDRVVAHWTLVDVFSATQTLRS
jgi:predicted ester cyclase